MGKKRNFDSFDIAKFVLSAVIVSIHTGVGGRPESFIFPWARIAVPIFFLITGYLFFLGYIPATPERRKAKLTTFIKRNIQLYLFWYIVQFLPTFVFSHYYEYGIVKSILLSLWDLIMGNGFVGSWYIIGSVIAVCIIVILMRYVSTIGLLCLSAPLYILCCLLSNYGNLFASSKVFMYLNGTLFQVIPPPYNNFIVALFWIVVGKAVFEYRDYIERFSKTVRGQSFLLFGLAVSLALLELEYMFVHSYGLSYVNDCYILLPVPCTILFILLLVIPCSAKGTDIMRATSTITYCTHGTFMRASGFILRRSGISHVSEWIFIVTLISCWALSIVILKLEKRPELRILRYCH